MAIYTYRCDCGEEQEQLRSIADRNRLEPCVVCGDGSMLKRIGIELQKSPHVQGGTCRHYRN